MSHRERATLPPNPRIATADRPTSSPRHVLPSNLPDAIKHLGDQELDQLLAAVIEEQQRRGKKPSVFDKSPSKRVEAAAVSLPPAKVNAVRAAFKAGVRPSKIAKQFQMPQAVVRKILSSK